MAALSDDARWHELQWCLHGPDLLDEPGIPLFRWPEATAATHRALPPTPGPLHHRLGRRFEQHWQHALEQLPGWTVLASGVQLRAEGRTLGELDLLVSGEGEVWHLELAVKFYLCAPGRSGDAWADWIGPNGRDRLDRKLERMRDHQLPLGQSDHARSHLAARELPAPTRSAAVLHGVRFAHWHDPRPDAAGRWCTRAERPEALPMARVLTRPQWLGFTPPTSADQVTGDRLRDAIDAASHRGPPQLVDPSGMRWLVMP